MPLYDFTCEKCQKTEEFFMKIADYKRPICCEQEMKRIYSYSVVKDLEPYLDENLGVEPTYVKSKKHRKELMRERGVQEKFGKGWV